MIWPSVLFNLCVGLLFAAYLLRAVRRFERRADEFIDRIEASFRAHEEEAERAFAAELREYDTARDAIRASMRAQVDAAIAEMWSSHEKVASEAARVLAEAEAVLAELPPLPDSDSRPGGDTTPVPAPAAHDGP